MMTWSFVAVITKMLLLTDQRVHSMGEYVITRCRRRRSENFWELSVVPWPAAGTTAARHRSHVEGAVVIPAETVKERS